MIPEIASYLSYLAGTRRLSNDTVRAYRRDLYLYEDYLGREELEWDKVDSRAARNFLSELSARGDAAASINRSLSALRRFYDYYWKKDRVNVNPFKEISGLKKGRRVPLVLYSRDWDSLIDAVEGNDFENCRDRLLLELLYSTGCRVSEAAGINLKDFTRSYRELKVTGKGKKERIVFLGEPARDALQAYLPLREFRQDHLDPDAARALFLNQRGHRLTVRGIALLIQECVRRAGLTGKISPHSFRHTFATDMLNNGANIREVQEMLGHASLSTTQVYTHVGIEHLKQVYRKAHPHGNSMESPKGE